jgi:hypothetical protein
LCISSRAPNTADSTFCLSILCLFWVSSRPQLSPVTFSNTRERERKLTLTKAGARKQCPLHSHQSDWPWSRKQTTTNVGEDVGKWAFVPCWWECKLIQPLWKSLMRFLKEWKIDQFCDPAIPPLGIYPKECKSAYQRDSCISMFIAVCLLKNQILESVKVSKHQWVDEENMYVTQS